MKTVDLVIQNTTGLHARPAKTFVKLAKGFKSKVKVTHGSKQVNGKSLIGILRLGVKQDGAIRLIVDGADETEAARALVDAINTGLGETLHESKTSAVQPVKSMAPKQPAPVSAENVLIGTPASSGIAIGNVWQLVTQEITIETPVTLQPVPQIWFHIGVRGSQAPN